MRGRRKRTNCRSNSQVEARGACGCLPVGLLEAKNAQDSGESGFFKRPIKGKEAETNEQRSEAEFDLPAICQ